MQDDADLATLIALRRARLGKHGIERHQLFSLDAGIVVHALRTISAVFRAAAGLDRYQLAGLHAVRCVRLTVNALRPKHQFGQRRPINLCNLIALPVVPQFERGSL